MLVVLLGLPSMQSGLIEMLGSAFQFIARARQPTLRSRRAEHGRYDYQTGNGPKVRRNRRLDEARAEARCRARAISAPPWWC